MDPLALEVRSSGSIRPPNEKEWSSKNIHMMNREFSKLPPLSPKDKRRLPKITVCRKKKTKLSKQPISADCPSFIAWYLQSNYELAAIPSSFFYRILLLQVLDLSDTNIKSLPKSLPKLVALKKLCLRRCKLFMELSPQIGKLKNLEELDLDETQIMDLPAEIGELVKLRRLRVSFYGHANCSKKRLQSNMVIRPETISNLSQLIELSIEVDLVDKRWDDSVEFVVKELCNLKVLGSLSLYLPKVQLLDDFKPNGKLLVYPFLSHFRFIVGHQKRTIISRVPKEVESQFRKWEKCLKFVNGGSIPTELKGVLNCSTSFFLDRHATAVNLSEFGIENMKRLEFCLLAECNMMETIIDGESHQSEVHPSSAKHVLESLQYLSIYHMKNLGSIWKGRVRYGSFSKLKFLGLHTCPQLRTIFPHDLLENLVNLEEFILEDCPRVTNLISHASVSFMSDNLLPSLKRLLLLYLPELLSICNGLPFAPKLEIIGFYHCPKFKNISKKELSSKNLKKIKGDTQWWADMEWDETEWGTGLDSLMSLFSPISKDRDVMTQLVEDLNILETSTQNEEQPGKMAMTDARPLEKVSDSGPMDGGKIMGAGQQQPKLFASDKIENRKLVRLGFQSLVSSLNSLLPPTDDTKRKCTMQDIVERATSYIIQLRTRMEELSAKRDKLKKLPSGFVDPKVSYNDYSSNCLVQIRPYSDCVDIVLYHRREGRGFTLSRVLELLLHEGLDVVSCSSTTLDGRWIHNIRFNKLQVCDLKCFNASVLQQKLLAEIS